MEIKKIRFTLMMTALSLVAVALVLSSATYAWFTFSPDTNITPMEGKISDGGVNLLISENKDGPFDKSCPLNPTDFSEALKPVSTVDLNTFYASARQSGGYITTFRDVSDQVGQRLIHGTVYLQCLGGSCNVYFQMPGLDLGTDPQVLAAGRLALKITGGDGQSQTLFFRLDDMGNTTTAVSKPTVLEDNVVVAGIDDNGAAQFQPDPAVSISEYLADIADSKALCTMQPDEIATVEYWLYLEGCDLECYNDVQNREVVLKLGFSGAPIEQG